MSEGLISQQVIDGAFEWLLKSSDEIASAKANKSRKEYLAKKVFAKLFLHADGSVESRKAAATIHPDYEAAMEAYFVAEEVWERASDQRSRAETILECWRTQSASQRAINRIR